jgi:CBS domain-containing protein
MKVKDIMTTEPKTCAEDMTLAGAADLMWEGDCGILPVLDDRKVVGVVTDRDMYIALATRDRLASQMAVGEVARKPVVTCEPEEDVHAALAAMKTHRVRRLPVVGFGDTLLGIISMNDILLAARPEGPVRSEEVVETLQAICGHHHPAPHVIAA